jgi:hypothetical protein
MVGKQLWNIGKLVPHYTEQPRSQITLSSNILVPALHIIDMEMKIQFTISQDLTLYSQLAYSVLKNTKMTNKLVDDGDDNKYIVNLFSS